MRIRYTHTNLISRDWRRLVEFYTAVFQCVPVPPARDLDGEWLDHGTGVPGAHITGMHLRLPGHGDHGPTLEIFSYATVVDGPTAPANLKGFGHIAFEVEDVLAMVERVAQHGGSRVGEVVAHPVAGVGTLTFTYVADPDGNIVELQHWDTSPT